VTVIVLLFAVVSVRNAVSAISMLCASDWAIWLSMRLGGMHVLTLFVTDDDKAIEFEWDVPEGYSVAAVPASAAALNKDCVGRRVYFLWSEVGWCVGTITCFFTPTSRNGRRGYNFHIRWDAGDESNHNLLLEYYCEGNGPENNDCRVGSWVFLEK